jgi:hypothetical protein
VEKITKEEPARSANDKAEPERDGSAYRYMTPDIEQKLTQRGEIWGEEAQEESMNEGQNEKETLADLPRKSAQAFKPEF